MKIVRGKNEAYPGEFKVMVVEDIINNGLSLTEAYDKYFDEARGRVAFQRLYPQRYKSALRSTSCLVTLEKFEQNFIPPTEEEKVRLEKDLKECPYPAKPKSVSFIGKWVDLYKNHGGKERLMENRRGRKPKKEPVQFVEINDSEKWKIIHRLTEIRKQANLTGNELSMAIGRGEDYICKMENKCALPSLEVVLAILKVCKIKPSDFFLNL